MFNSFGMNGTLKKINSNDIAKIASGQVIVDLRSVVKELIENSLVCVDTVYSVGCESNEHRYSNRKLWS